ncbi:MAG: alpha/beta hydrolase [Nodosilinea sp.]
MVLKSLTYPPLSGEPPDWQLVALHGWGANAADLMGLAPYLRLSHFAMVFPDAPWLHPQVPGGRMWYGFPTGYDFRRTHNFEPQSDLQASRQALKTWLPQLAEETQIPLERTVLAGFSQGGAMTLDVGPKLPLAGQISLSGYLHGAVSPPLTPRPVMLVHGSFDPVVPLEAAEVARAGLQCQGQPSTFHKIAMGHEILPEVIALISEFCEDLRRHRNNP